MKRGSALLALLLLFAATALDAHDLFLRLDSFFLTPGSTARIRVLNGTFSKSENSVTRDRIRNLSIVGPNGIVASDTSMWSATGDTSIFRFAVPAPGTYVAAASLLPREITLKATDFNTYLETDGIPDVLAARRKSGELGKDAAERYSKHVKALIQVGTSRNGSVDKALGYPAELVPLDNPYSTASRGWLRVRADVDGKPVGNQLLVTGGRTPRGTRFTERRIRTDANGIARIRIAQKGQWYVKFINMVPVTGQPNLDYESKWATLTFQVR
ncbi:MAG TPA: DUF4198 domain-containing protein [Gemmatimonadaceae bacterium]|nr:DUF4198 domain-containing protein [Gemmatimonadaceae bacterium]